MEPLSPDVSILPIGPGVLYPDLLPSNVWGSNLRGILSRPEWDRLRMPVAQAADMRCEVCRQPSRNGQTRARRTPDCHELWYFESVGDSKVQRLLRLIALCVECHRVQHIGLAQLKNQMWQVRAQLKAVNSWTDAEVDLAIRNAEERFRWRGQYQWDLDLSVLQGKVQVFGHPSLLIPAADREALGNSFRP
jgi:hypothetical protein